MVQIPGTLAPVNFLPDPQAAAHAVAETVWLRQLLVELHHRLPSATIVYRHNNINAVYVAANPVQHRRTKYIEINVHFVGEKLTLGHVWVLDVPSQHQFAP
jgi:hypothetical protein